MGSRGQVHIRDNNIFLYTHFNEYKLIEDVQKVIKETGHKNPGRLTADIFKTFSDDPKSEINSSYIEHCYTLIVIDCLFERVHVLKYPNKSIEKKRTMSIEEFLNFKRSEIE